LENKRGVNERTVDSFRLPIAPIQNNDLQKGPLKRQVERKAQQHANRDTRTKYHQQ